MVACRSIYSDIKETGGTIPAVTVISQYPPERPTRSSHSLWKTRQAAWRSITFSRCHERPKDLGPLHSRAIGPGHWSRLPKNPGFSI